MCSLKAVEAYYSSFGISGADYFCTFLIFKGKPDSPKNTIDHERSIIPIMAKKKNFTSDNAYAQKKNIPFPTGKGKGNPGIKGKTSSAPQQKIFNRRTP